MFDDDENKSDSDSSASDDSSTSSASVEGSEPPPAGDDTEPAPAGETSSSEDTSDKPLEDNEGHSDSSAETDGSDSSKSSSSSDSSSSDSSSSSSGDSSSADKSVQPPSEEDVSSALTRALEDHSVPMDDSVRVTTSDSGMYNLAVRLSSSFNPLPQVHDDTQSLQDGSVEGAAYLLQGAVQIIGDQVRVTLRITSVETSAILQQSKADGSGSSSLLDAITGAAGDALAGLPALNAS